MVEEAIREGGNHRAIKATGSTTRERLVITDLQDKITRVLVEDQGGVSNRVVTVVPGTKDQRAKVVGVPQRVVTVVGVVEVPGTKETRVVGTKAIREAGIRVAKEAGIKAIRVDGHNSPSKVATVGLELEDGNNLVGVVLEDGSNLVGVVLEDGNNQAGVEPEDGNNQALVELEDGNNRVGVAITGAPTVLKEVVGARVKRVTATASISSLVAGPAG
jgi:hypothetical protein